MEQVLADLNESESGIISTIDISGISRKILMDIGLVEGTKITVKKKAPFNGSLNIIAGGGNLSIRRQDAQKIFVTKE